MVLEARSNESLVSSARDRPSPSGSCRSPWKDLSGTHSKSWNAGVTCRRPRCRTWADLTQLAWRYERRRRRRDNKSHSCYSVLAARNEPVHRPQHRCAPPRTFSRKTDTVGAQLAYDEVMRTACSRAALAGPPKYPRRCDTVLHPDSDQEPIDPCIGTLDDPAMQTECNG